MAGTTDSASERSSKPSNRLENLPSTPDKKPTWKDFDTIVRVRVGEGDTQEVFEIYKGLLKFYSGYFRAAIDNVDNKRFAQEEENTIDLLEEEVDTFRMLKSWIYTRDFSVDASACNATVSFINMWCFADRRQMPLIQNQAIDALHKTMVVEHSQPKDSYSDVYANTCEGSVLRRYLVFSQARRYSRSEAEGAFRDSANWPHDYLVDLGKELVARPSSMNKEEFAAIDMCDFHVHEEGVRCNKDKK